MFICVIGFLSTTTSCSKKTGCPAVEQANLKNKKPGKTTSGLFPSKSKKKRKKRK